MNMLNLSVFKSLIFRHSRFLLICIFFLFFTFSALAENLKIELTKEEQDFLKKNPVIKIGSDDTWEPYLFKDNKGKLVGFDVDIIHFINRVTGANIELISGAWKEIVKRAKKHEIDGLATSAPLDKRKPFFNFSDIYVNEFPILILPSIGRLNIRSLQEFSGKKIAVQEGNAFLTGLLNSYKKIEIVKTASEREGIKVMLEGKVDGAISSTSTFFSHQKNFLKSIKIGLVITEKPLKIVYSVRKDWPELISIINKALRSMPTEIKNNIYYKWFRVDPSELFYQNKNLIRTAIIDNFYPYSFINRQGKPDGFIVDLAKAITRVMGMELEFIVETWGKNRAFLKSGQIDFSPIMAYSRERDKEFDFSAPHTITYDAFFTRKGTPKIEKLEDLKEKKIIILNKDLVHDYLKSSKHISSNQLILVDDFADAFRVLASGTGDVTLMPGLPGTITIKNLKLKNLEVTPIKDKPYKRELTIAVKEGNQELLERLNQGLNILKETGELHNIHKKWFASYESGKMIFIDNLKYFLWFILFLSVVGLFLFIWSLSLKKQVIARTRELEIEIKERKAVENELRKKNENITHDLVMAENIQKHLFTEYISPAYLNISTRYLPHSHVSGDIYKIYPQDNGSYNLFLGDSAGHGIAAALSTVMANGILLEKNGSLKKIMEHLNEVFEKHLPDERFMSAILTNITPDGKLKTIRAGHPPLIVIPADGSAPVFLGESGTLLGIMPKPIFIIKEISYQLKAGDRGFLYTDGVYERKNHNGETFGLDKLYDFLNENKSVSLDTLLSRLIETTNSYASKNEIDDDITLIAFEYI